MSIDMVRAAEQDILRFWRHLDRRDYAAIIEMLTPDCRWLREAWIEGHPAIAESLSRRPEDLVTRHVVTNMIVEEQGGDLLVSHLVTTFAGRGPAGGGPLPTAAPALVAEVGMTIVQREGRRRISRIEPEIAFR